MNMIKDANPADKTEFPDMPSKQTVELRSPDGSADIYKLFAGLVIAVEHGLEMDNALETAGKLYVDYNVFKNKDRADRKKLESLPASCWESAECLLAQRTVFERDGVFPAGVIDNVAAKLKAYNDKDLSEKLFNKNDEIRKLVNEYLHCS
jgi:glutamine synthetase